MVHLSRQLSNCVSLNNLISCHLDLSQEDRERMVVRRFKFEEPRIEQIQDLEVCLNSI